MLTICLDESGNFEKNKNGYLIIGGVTFEGDNKKEEENIRKFYNQACREIESSIYREENIKIKVKYPNGIHSTDNKKGKLEFYNKFDYIRDEEKRKSIGTKINKKMSEKVINYIRGREGYNITALIKNKELNENEFFEKGKFSFELGANLYERMATKFLYNNIFYNPLINKENDKIFLNIATRTISAKPDSKKYNELVELGYWPKSNNDGSYRFYVTNYDTYRSALASKLNESKLKANITDINVESINYENDKTSPFLYLADTICDLLSNEFYQMKSQTEIFNLIDSIKEKTGKQLFCFYYDDIDNIWCELVQAIKEKDLIKALDKKADIENSLSANKELYIKFWNNSIETDLINLFDKNKGKTYLLQLDTYFDKENSKYEKGRVIAESILNIAKSKGEEDIILDKFKYDLNEKIAISYNHRGNIKKATEYFEKCLVYKDKIGRLNKVKLINRYSVLLTNLCRYEDAIKQLNEVIIENYEDIKCCEAGFSDDAREYGKLFSSLGQNLAFLNKYEESENNFKKALELFNSESDRETTKTYLLHLFIESNEKEKYEELMYEITKERDFKKQLEYFIDEDSNLRFKLYFYMKALNRFYREELDKNFIKNIISIFYKKQYSNNDFNEHPKELTAKYIQKLAFRYGMKREGIELAKSNFSYNKDEFTMNIINYKSIIELIQMEKMDSNNKKDIYDKETIRYINKIKDEINGQALVEKAFNEFIELSSKDIEKCIEAIDNKLTYMYR